MTKPISSFKILGHSTKREWAIYLIVATPINLNKKKLIYVGKVGDNRDGCNPVISRVGNHFSYNKIHSQMRTIIQLIGNDETENYNYEYYYAHFGKYDSVSTPEEKMKNRNRINDLERTLNLLIQEHLSNPNKTELSNPYKGKKLKIDNGNKKNKSDIKIIIDLINKAIEESKLEMSLISIKSYQKEHKN